MASGTINVAKKKLPADEPAGDKPAVGKTTVKLAADLHRRARVVASDAGLDLSEYLDQILRPIIDQAYRDLGERITSEQQDDD